MARRAAESGQDPDADAADPRDAWLRRPRDRLMLRRLWEGWKVVAHAIGTVQARIILSVLYILVVGPVAIVRRIVADPLELRPRPRPSHWIVRPPSDASLEAARKQ